MEVDERTYGRLRFRVLALLEREKAASLTPEENTELQHYLQLEHRMRLAKARVRQQL